MEDVAKEEICFELRDVASGEGKTRESEGESDVECAQEK